VASTQASTTDAGEIYDAIREGRHEDVQALVDANLDLFSRNEHGHAALSEATHKADVESCRILLSGRAGPETKCNGPACRQARPVHIAAMVNSVPILELLVAKGANISSLSENNENALHWAARHDSTEAMKYLISLHLAKDSKDSRGEIPLHHAVRSRCSGSVMYLLSLQRDAPPPYDDLLNNSKETPLDLAVTDEWLLGVELLISDGMSDPSQRRNLQEAFHRAALLASYEIFDALMSSGVDIHAPDQFGRQPLHEAARSKTDSSRKIRHLLDYGANIEAQCLLEISTPLVPAQEYLKAIPANQAPVRPKQHSQGNLLYKHDTTPLLFAASFGTFASVQPLIQAGANCAARNVRGDMVHNSLYNPDAAVLKLLLEDSTNCGANVTVATACMEAVITAPAASRIQRSSAHINILLDGGARMHDSGSDEGSLLYIATLARNAEIVRLTLARPLDEMAVKNVERVYSELRNFLLQNEDILALFNHRDDERGVADRNQILKEKAKKVKKERAIKLCSVVCCPFLYPFRCLFRYLECTVATVGNKLERVKINSRANAHLAPKPVTTKRYRYVPSHGPSHLTWSLLHGYDL
jgi:ankyrin repeat protein